jgi:hypothetical protein
VNWKSLFSLTKQSTDNADDFNPWLPLQMKLNNVHKVKQSRSTSYLVGNPVDCPPNIWWIAETRVLDFERSCTIVIQEFEGNVEWDLCVSQRENGQFFLRIAPKKFCEYLDKPLSAQDFQEFQWKNSGLNKFSYIHVREQEFGASTGTFCLEALVDVPRLVESL